jgi:basic membrane protein A
VYTTITNFLTEGNQSGVLVFDLANDGVGYSTTGGFIDDITSQLDDLRALIVTGQEVVPQVIGG